MELFSEINNSLKLVTIFVKSSNSDVWLDFHYSSDKFQEKNCDVVQFL